MWIRSRCTATTRTVRRWRIYTPLSRWACQWWMLQLRDWVAAPLRPGPPATLQPRTCSTCCTGWALRRAWIWTWWLMLANSSRTRSDGPSRLVLPTPCSPNEIVHGWYGKRRKHDALSLACDECAVGPKILWCGPTRTTHPYYWSRSRMTPLGGPRRHTKRRCATHPPIQPNPTQQNPTQKMKSILLPRWFDDCPVYRDRQPEQLLPAPFCDCGKSFLVLLVLEQRVPLDKARVSVEVESQILHLPKLEEEVLEVIIACLFVHTRDDDCPSFNGFLRHHRTALGLCPLTCTLAFVARFEPPALLLQPPSQVACIGCTCVF
eukprot:m.258702 g.258702  ORF g.258702 m.258702 type:complete len:320 (-) comp26625_c0_seq1:125-1084(-)